MSTFVFFLGEERSLNASIGFLCYSLSDQIFFCDILFLLSGLIMVSNLLL